MVTSGAQSARPYKEGPVVNVAYVRTLPGQFDKYMAYIMGDYAKLMEAQKAAGIILGWSAYNVQTRHPDDPNLILTVTYPNMAALDNLQDRQAPIMQKVLNLTREQSQAANAQREQIRRQIGSELWRTVLPNP
jgi:hypothetical protein